MLNNFSTENHQSNFSKGFIFLTRRVVTWYFVFWPFLRTLKKNKHYYGFSTSVSEIYPYDLFPPYFLPINFILEIQPLPYIDFTHLPQLLGFTPLTW